MSVGERAFDERVLRIVYDGAPEAGKTTNVRRLHETLLSGRDGVFASPGDRGRRTEFFDFRDFDGGLVGGGRLRCQVISVPGQPDLGHRRRHLLGSADAVVLVVDASAARLEESRAMVRSLTRVLAPRGTPFVVQLNKLDAPDALDVAALAEALRIDASTPVVGATATEGCGVADTFLTAVRLATTRVRPDGEAASIVVERSPEELHEALLRLEGRRS